MEGKMSLRVAYIAVWVITGLIALCSEEGFLPVEYLSHDPNTDYVVGVVSFLTAIGGTYLALRLLAFKGFLLLCLPIRRHQLRFFSCLCWRQVGGRCPSCVFSDLLATHIAFHASDKAIGNDLSIFRVLSDICH